VQQRDQAFKLWLDQQVKAAGGWPKIDGLIAEKWTSSATCESHKTIRSQRRIGPEDREFRAVSERFGNQLLRVP